MTRPRRSLLAAAAALAAVGVLAGCAGPNDALAEQYRAGSGANYIAGDGTLLEVAAADRGAPIEFGGINEFDEQMESTDFAGEVLVVNFWYAGCAPCRAEAPDLKALDDKHGGNGAQFIGVNVFDQADTARTFSEEFGIEYPSVMDAVAGDAKLAFAGEVPPKAVPTTLVLDKQHRVAARLVGQIQDRSILDTLIRDAIAEPTAP